MLKNIYNRLSIPIFINGICIMPYKSKDIDISEDDKKLKSLISSDSVIANNIPNTSKEVVSDVNLPIRRRGRKKIIESE